MPSIEDRISSLEAAIDELSKTIQPISEGMPALKDKFCSTASQVVNLFQGIGKDGVTLPQMVIVNKTGRPVVVIKASDNGGGMINIFNANGQEVASFYADDVGDAVVALGDVDGKLRTGMTTANGNGRLDLFGQNGASHSFGPR